MSEARVFAHLYRQGRLVNVDMRFRRVPCVGEFIAAEDDDQSWADKLDLESGTHHFEVLSVIHIDLNMARDIEAEIWCRYVTVSGYGRIAAQMADQRSREPEAQ